MADDTLDLVKDLIQTCKDGETGYAHAAGVATDPQLKAYFSEAKPGTSSLWSGAPAGSRTAG